MTDVTVTQADHFAAELFAKEWPGLDLPMRATAFQMARHRQSATTEALAAMEQARRAIEMQRSYGCGRCNGDCGSANPPVLACPMQVAQEALATLTAKIEEMRNGQ